MVQSPSPTQHCGLVGCMQPAMVTAPNQGPGPSCDPASPRGAASSRPQTRLLPGAPMVPGTSTDDCTRRQPQNSLLGWRTSPRAGTWPTPGTRTCSRLGLSLARCGGGAKLKPSWHLPQAATSSRASREGGGARRGPCTPGRSAGDSGTRRALEAPRPAPGTDTLPRGELRGTESGNFPRAGGRVCRETDVATSAAGHKLPQRHRGTRSALLPTPGHRVPLAMPPWARPGLKLCTVPGAASPAHFGGRGAAGSPDSLGPEVSFGARLVLDPWSCRPRPPVPCRAPHGPPQAPESRKEGGSGRGRPRPTCLACSAPSPAA